jgi:FkbM family methyltransferase
MTGYVKRMLKTTMARLGYYVYTERSLPHGANLHNDLSQLMDPKTFRIILDVGANIGQSAIPYAEHFPHATVYSFEPSQTTFERLVGNTVQHSQIHPINCAVGSTSTMAKLRIHERSSLNSLVGAGSEVDADSHSTEDVQVVAIDDFVKEHGIDHIDLLKIDTEGYETEVLVGANEMLNNHAITFVLSEVTFRPTDRQHTNFFTLNDLLTEAGYGVYAFYDLHHWSASPRQLGYCNVLHTVQ